MSSVLRQNTTNLPFPSDSGWSIMGLAGFSCTSSLWCVVRKPPPAWSQCAESSQGVKHSAEITNGERRGGTRRKQVLIVCGVREEALVGSGEPFVHETAAKRQRLAGKDAIHPPDYLEMMWTRGADLVTRVQKISGKALPFGLFGWSSFKWTANWKPLSRRQMSTQPGEYGAGEGNGQMLRCGKWRQRMWSLTRRKSPRARATAQEQTQRHRQQHTGTIATAAAGAAAAGEKIAPTTPISWISTLAAPGVSLVISSSRLVTWYKIPRRRRESMRYATSEMRWPRGHGREARCLPQQFASDRPPCLTIQASMTVGHGQIGEQGSPHSVRPPRRRARAHRRRSGAALDRLRGEVQHPAATQTASHSTLGPFSRVSTPNVHEPGVVVCCLSLQARSTPGRGNIKHSCLVHTKRAGVCYGCAFPPFIIECVSEVKAGLGDHLLRPLSTTDGMSVRRRTSERRPLANGETF